MWDHAESQFGDLSINDFQEVLESCEECENKNKSYPDDWMVRGYEFITTFLS